LAAPRPAVLALQPQRAVSSNTLLKNVAPRSIEDAICGDTRDKIAGAIAADVTLRAEPELGGRAEALAPHSLRSLFIPFGGPQNHRESPEDAVCGGTSDEIACVTAADVTLRAEPELGGRAEGRASA
jgi:hypothetical protein